MYIAEGLGICIFPIELHFNINNKIPSPLHFRYTQKGDTIYAMFLTWPPGGNLLLGAPVTGSQTSISMLGYNGTLTWKPQSRKGVTISLSGIGFAQMPSTLAWTLKLERLQNIE